MLAFAIVCLFASPFLRRLIRGTEVVSVPVLPWTDRVERIRGLPPAIR